MKVIFCFLAAGEKSHSGGGVLASWNCQDNGEVNFIGCHYQVFATSVPPGPIRKSDHKPLRKGFAVGCGSYTESPSGSHYHRPQGEGRADGDHEERGKGVILT